jgi:hypothetical protein
MHRYRVLSALDYDQVRYAAGDVVEMTPEVAAPLLACGCIAELPPPERRRPPAASASKARPR